MDWKYYIPHLWDREREVWEDIYLLPVEDIGYDGKALWLTINALGDVDSVSERAEMQAEFLNQLGDRDYYIDGTEMIVKAIDLSKMELLEWVRVWLREHRLPISNLIEAPVEEFRHKAMYADLVVEYREMMGMELGSNN